MNNYYTLLTFILAISISVVLKAQEIIAATKPASPQNLIDDNDSLNLSETLTPVQVIDNERFPRNYRTQFMPANDVGVFQAIQLMLGGVLTDEKRDQKLYAELVRNAIYFPLIGEDRLPNEYWNDYKDDIRFFDMFVATTSEVNANGGKFAEDKAIDQAEIVLGKLIQTAASKEEQNLFKYYLIDQDFTNVLGVIAHLHPEKAIKYSKDLLVYKPDPKRALDQNYASFLTTGKWPTDQDNYKFIGQMLNFSSLDNESLIAYEWRDAGLYQSHSGPHKLIKNIKWYFYKSYLDDDPLVVVFDGHKRSGEMAACILPDKNGVLYFCESKYDGDDKVPQRPKLLDEQPKVLGVISLCKDKDCQLPKGFYESLDLSQRTASNLGPGFQRVLDMYQVNDMKLVFHSHFDMSVQVGDNRSEIKRLENKPGQSSPFPIQTKPSFVNEYKLTYSFDDAIKLAPGDFLYFEIPDHISKYAVGTVLLGHYQKGRKVTNDPYPAYTSVHLHDPTIFGSKWRFWAGRKDGKKFAENSSRGKTEYDNMHEWPNKGHCGVGSSNCNKHNSNKQLLYANAARIEIHGADNVYIKELSIHTIPPKSDLYWEKIYSPKTNFGHPENMHGRWYGGGQKYNAQFPKAYNLKEDRKLTFSLDKYAGKKLSIVTISCGDTEAVDDGDSANGKGTPGGAKLDVKFSKRGKDEMLLDYINVPLQGFIDGYPSDQDYIIQKGDKIIIESHKDNTYIMGIRMGFNH